ncbi:hypothetical protein [Brevibacterium sp.]|uniref:hypothetical protein n=1 Tax=Brevibacterium sp. TaxID=1701 RepID=UPI0028121C7A|nr:hypothetical protein [Brevibacterium sp.]
MKRIWSKPQKNALDGDGPIVDRARQALYRVAAQFGEVTDRERTQATVTTPDGLELVFAYDNGNYIFSRVYNLSISTVLPMGTEVQAGTEVAFKGSAGPAFVPAKTAGGLAVARTATTTASSATTTSAMADLNAVAGDHLRGIDLLSAQVRSQAGRRVLHLTPMGGSFVWVLIPPVFKATAFPPGEPGRILELIRALRGFSTSATTPKGHHA